MNQTEKLFNNFIINAEVFGSQEKRKKLLDLLYTFFSTGHTDPNVLSELSEGEWKVFIKPIKKIVNDSSFYYRSYGEEIIATKLTLEITEWLENTYQKWKKERKVFSLTEHYNTIVSSFENLNERDWINLLEYLNKTYPNFGKYWDFYSEKLSSIYSQLSTIKKQDRLKIINEELEAVKKKILEDYDMAMKEKLVSFQEELLNKEFIVFSKNIKQKTEKLEMFINLLENIFGFINIDVDDLTGRFWDLSLGFWKYTIDYEEIYKYSEILKENEQIQRLAELLGRLREHEELKEKELIERTEIVHEWKVYSGGKSEIRGIHFSDDLSSLLPSEIALLSEPVTEIIFAKKFAEKKLLTFQYSDRIKKETVVKEKKEIEKAKKEGKKGPIIACIDTSGSMAGAPETVAKTLLLALLRVALKEKRRCYLISFSTNIQTLEVSDLVENLPKLVTFLQMGFHGGTDASPALIEALNQLETEKYEKADVVMISDFIMGSLEESLEEKIKRHKKEKNNKFHSVVISNQRNPKIIQQVFDNVWILDPLNNEIIEETIEEFSKKIF